MNNVKYRVYFTKKLKISMLEITSKNIMRKIMSFS